MLKENQMKNDNQVQPELVRVSVLFRPPTGLQASNETPDSRYQKITRDTNQKRKQLIKWLRRHRIDYSDVTMMDAFSTVFLNIPRDAIAKLRTVPDVAEVDEEVPMQFDPL
jgi:hypothetical protein